jgi:hypothetical protein
MKLRSLFVNGLIAAIVAMNSISFVAFATGEIPTSISLMSDKVTPGFGMEFQIFDEPNRRQNVNHGEAMAWPDDYLLEIEYNTEYPAGVWGVHRVYSEGDLAALADNIYRFNVPDTAGWYRLTVKNGIGDRYASEIFEIVDEPFLVVDRIVEPGDDVVVKIYDENGDLWDIDSWGNGANQYSLDVYGIGNAGFVTHSGLGMANNGSHQMTDNENGTYTYDAGNTQGEFYVGLQRGSGASLVELDSTSYDVYGNGGSDDEEEEDEDSDDDEDDDLPEVLDPEDYEDDDEDEDVCDPGEYCPEEDEEEDDDDDNSGRRFSLNIAAHAKLPKFEFVNWAPKIILEEGFSYDDYDFESDSYDLVEDPYTCADLGNHWGQTLIQNLLNSSMYPVEVSDDDKHLCRPDKDITREQLMAWLLFVFYPDLADQAYDLDFDGAENPYEDLDEEFGPYVLKATEAGVVHGEDGCAKTKKVNCKFGNGNTVNRAEILKMAIEASGIEFSVEDLKAQYPEKDPIKMFTDIKNDKDWFYGYLYFATAHDVIQGVQVGDNKYEAMMGAGLSFSQAAKIINLIAELN